MAKWYKWSPRDEHQGRRLLVGITLLILGVLALFSGMAWAKITFLSGIFISVGLLMLWLAFRSPKR